MEESTNEEFPQSINKGFESLNLGADHSEEREEMNSLLYEISVNRFFKKEPPYLNCDGDLVLYVDSDGEEVVAENFEKTLKLLKINPKLKVKFVIPERYKYVLKTKQVLIYEIRYATELNELKRKDEESVKSSRSFYEDNEEKTKDVEDR